MGKESTRGRGQRQSSAKVSVLQESQSRKRPQQLGSSAGGETKDMRTWDVKQSQTKRVFVSVFLFLLIVFDMGRDVHMPQSVCGAQTVRLT